ncbi:protoporphyrinogen oxidase [Arthrobacter sp. zg-Y769]|uniref:protoporphyrinogen oxidase n=1 Tax=Arthrobacter sp. zg-Y769 TaxID=2894191 RepID=UPI001E4648DA|nr:protoporphyrinogen oxidase [Arthrobacter sp. zg-Y769]MCC9203662.1 protoporphyrinogen oxidase [Arthrobacter sp. zg-Y769]
MPNRFLAKPEKPAKAEKSAKPEKPAAKTGTQPETPTGPSAIVVGGGISGLIAARDLQRAGVRVTVLEASDRFGGCVGRHSVAGIELDSGAESFATRSPAVPELVGELGLADAVTAPNPAGSWLQLAADDLPSGAQRMPASGLLGIPADPRHPDIARALGRAGAARAAMDKVLPVGNLFRRGSMSLGELVRTRMGEAVLRRLVTPVVGGVYSADPDVLDVDSVAPGLRAAVSRHGSLAAAVGAMRAAAPAGSAVAGLEGGMGRLAEALVSDLETAGAGLRTGIRAESLAREAEGWRVRCSNGRELAADAVVVAAEGPAAADLIATALPEVSAYRPQPGPGVALVTLVVDLPELDAMPRGTGVLVAREVEGVDAKAMTHATAKWQWLADSTGPGTHVLRLSYGRALSAEDSAAEPSHVDRADDDLFRQAVADASGLLQVGIRADDVVGWDVVRWVGALPSAAVGHKDRVGAVRAAVAEAPGLEAVGAWLAGTGLAAVTADTRTRMAALSNTLL